MKIIFKNVFLIKWEKLLRIIMRTFLFLCFTTAFSFAPVDTFSQNAKIKIENDITISVVQIFELIQQQAGYKFVYSDELFINAPKVELKKGVIRANELLKKGLSPIDCSYEFTKNETIIVKRNNSPALKKIQQISINGTVSDEDGLPLPGANIIEKGTTNGTQTDFDGKFSLTTSNENIILVVSFIGFTTLEIAVTDLTGITVVLEEDTASLDEVVLTGYGTQRKRDLTGSIVKADIESFREAPNTSIMQSLQGTVPGIQIGQTNRAGQDPTINIRGETTINGSKSPLFVVDGAVYRGSISDINPSDIESVYVLKDASSKAVYGAKAANGVILIKTKGGKRSMKPTISYSGFYSVSEPTVNDRLLNRDEFLESVKAIEYRSAYTEESGYTQPNPDWDYSQSEMSPVVLEGANNGTDYDWWENSTSRGQINNHVINITGGGEKSSYYISGGFTDQKALIINDEYKRTNFRVNVDTDLADWLTIGTNTYLSFTDYSGSVPSIGNLSSMAPVVAPKDEEGNWIINPTGFNTVNPFLNAQAKDSDKRHQINMNNYAKFTIPWVKGLTYRLNFNYTLNARNHGHFNEFGAGITGYASKESVNSYYTLLDNIIDYTNSFGDHDVNATFVYGFNKLEWENTVAEGDGYSNPALGFNSLEQATNQNISSGAWEESNLYQMLRVAYDYKNRYLLTATLRRDGFSGFAENNKFGLFPSIGIGWVLSDEEFMRESVEFLKLRASYGVTGNQSARYSSLAQVSSGDGQKYVFGDGGPTVNGQYVSSMANPNLSWETTYEINFGMDFTFFNSKIRGSVDYYNSTTQDLLWDVVIPNVTGFNSVTANVGELKNQGVEIGLYTTPVETDDFSWDLTGTFAYNKNEIVALLGDNDGDGIEDDLVSSGLFIGESLGAIYGYEIEGIWQVGDDIIDGYFPGTYKIKDQAGPDGTGPDGKITAADDRVILGRTTPLFTLGIMNKFDYKNFSLNFLFNIIEGGNDAYRSYNRMAAGANTPGVAATGNWFNSYDVWSPINPDATFAQAWQSPSIEPQILQSRSFVRLQDISLSYTLEKELTDKIGLGSMKVYLSGKNLLTITDWDGWDPETNQGIASDAYPVMRSLTLGLNVTF